MRGWIKTFKATWQIVDECERGNPYAMIDMAVLCRKYTRKETEHDWYIKAIEVFETEQSDASALADARIALGRFYERTESHESKRMAYGNYCYAREADPAKTDDVVRCLAKGIGCDKDPEKAAAVLEAGTDVDNILSCCRTAMHFQDLNNTYKATIYLQRGLLAQNADDCPREKAWARFYLARLGETDPYGCRIDPKEAEEDLRGFLSEKEALKLACKIFAENKCKAKDSMPHMLLLGEKSFVFSTDACYELAQYFRKAGDSDRYVSYLKRALRAKNFNSKTAALAKLELAKENGGHSSDVSYKEFLDCIEILIPYALSGDAKCLRAVVPVMKKAEFSVWNVLLQIEFDDAKAAIQEYILNFADMDEDTCKTAGEKIFEDPYRTGRELSLALWQADIIAKLTEPFMSTRYYERIGYAVAEAEWEMLSEGKSFLPQRELYDKVHTICYTDLFRKNQKDRIFSSVKQYFEYVRLPESECYVSRKILETEKRIIANLQRLSEWKSHVFSKHDSIYLPKGMTNKQGVCAIQCLQCLDTNKQMSIIFGRAGTGKSTCLKYIAEMYERANPAGKVSYMALTQSAADHLREITGREVVTVKKAVAYHEKNIEYGERSMLLDALDPMDADLIVIDAMNMMDTILFADFLDQVKPGTHLVMSGDYNLIGPSAPRVVDFLARGAGGLVERIYYLDDAIRWPKGSVIRRFAEGGNLSMSSGEQDDLEIVYVQSKEQAVKEAVTIFRQSYNADDPGAVKILCMTKDTRAGTQVVNELLKDISDENSSVAVEPFAMTVYDALEMEFNKVIILLTNEPEVLPSRQLLYTAVTRAKEKAWLITRKDVLEKAVNTEQKYNDVLSKLSEG